MYIKDTKFGYGVYMYGTLVIEFATYEEAKEYMEGINYGTV